MALVSALAIWAFAPARTSEAAKTLTPAQIADKYGASVVRITTPVLPASATGTGKPGRIGGTGFMASKGGWIVTSLAVLQGHGLSAPLKVSVEYVLRSGRYGKATGIVVSRSGSLGTAAIKVDPREVPVTPLPMGDSDSMAVGQRMVALGRQPNMSLQQATGTVTRMGTMGDGATGNRHVLAIADNLPRPSGPRSELLAGVGGPLFDSTGRVIGMVGPAGKGDAYIWGYSGDITRQAVGSYWVASEVASAGESGISYKPGRTYMGVSWDWLTPELAQKLGEPPGAEITDVTLGSPADRAGIHAADSIFSPYSTNGVFNMVGGDVIVSVDGVRLTNSDDLATIIRHHKPGDVLVLRLWRNRQQPGRLLTTPAGSAIPVRIWRDHQLMTVRVKLSTMAKM